MRHDRLLLLFLLCFWVPPGSEAGEPVTIRTLQADPKPYHLRVVTLHGTVHQVQLITPFNADSFVNAPGSVRRFDFQCSFVHPPYTFVLTDGTGFLQIVVRGRPPCVSKLSPAEPPDVAEGDKVAIDAQVTVESRYKEGSDQLVLQALALKIGSLGTE